MDMVAVKLLIPEDPEELALNLNGKKRKLNQKDFNQALVNAHIPEKAIKNLWKRVEKDMQNWSGLINHSFLSNDLKTAYLELINLKADQIELDLKTNENGIKP